MICAIDCDLRESYCVTDDGRSGRGISPFDAMDAMSVVNPALLVPYTILFEVASPVSFNRADGSHAAMYQLAKWAIWNVSQAMRLHMFARTRGFQRVLVSPSNEWTRGFDLKTRHAMAKCKQKQKDLRECEAMIWFYNARPECWQPLPDFLATL